MRDSILQVTIAGIIGAAVMNVIMYLVLLLGVAVTAPWTIAADVFLAAQLVNTMAGLIIGLIGTVGLSIASAVVILLVLIWTGYDYAVPKGIIATNAFSFMTMGLFMPLLNVSPQVQRQPLTNIAAFVVLTIIGAVMGAALLKFHAASGREIRD